MSAWIVSKTHIDAIVTALAKLRDREVDPDDLPKIGQRLWEENHRSFRHRYPKHAVQCPEYTYTAVKWPASPSESGDVRAFTCALGAVCKLLDCYEYQSCEHPEWPESLAYGVCQRLRAAVCAALPGYKQTPWGLEDGPDDRGVRGADVFVVLGAYESQEEVKP